MSDTQRIIELLKSDNPVQRYNACEELMVSRQPLPQGVIDALNSLTKDSNPDVAGAAQRVLALHTGKQFWGMRATDWIVMLVISFGIIFGSSFSLGPVLFGGDAVSRRFAVAYHCPGAIGSTESRGPIRPTTSDPTGPRGQTVEVTCSFSDGSTKVISSDEYAGTAIVGMFIGGALVGVGAVIVLVPIYVFWRKNSNTIIGKKSSSL